MELQTPNPLIQKGTILAYRVYDIGEEIDLREVERILKQSPGKNRLSITRTGRNALTMRNPPVQLSLGDVTFQLKGNPVQAEILAKIFDYGAASLLFQIPISPGTAWQDLVKSSAVLNGDVPGSQAFDEIALKKKDELVDLLKPAIKTRSQWPVFEDYTIFFFDQVENIGSPSQLLKSGLIPELILGESQEPLSSESRKGILENFFQYAESDMTVIDWNSAVVIEPSGSRDIPDVIEFALTHLLEFRYYDDLLDRKLTWLYDEVEAHRGGIMRNFSSLSREANSRFLEFSEFIERVDNSLKIVGDFYLAVIYRAAIRRFRIPDWQQSVTRKMNTLARVSEVLQSEVNVVRSHLLELIIIGLILFEIVQAILRN